MLLSIPFSSYVIQPMEKSWLLMDITDSVRYTSSMKMHSFLVRLYSPMETTPLPENFYRVSAKALITDKEWKFLLIKSPQSKCWDLPGGGIDFWEIPEECLRREIREEMRLEIIHFNPQPCYFYTARWLNSAFSVANIVYQVTLENLAFAPTDECEEIWFFDVQEARKLATYPKTKEFLKHYNPQNHIHI